MMPEQPYSMKMAKVIISQKQFTDLKEKIKAVAILEENMC
jgi:hypothetical protein